MDSLPDTSKFQSFQFPLGSHICFTGGLRAALPRPADPHF
jgi:hypothetical protein